jgi:hypothetical protein
MQRVQRSNSIISGTSVMSSSNRKIAVSLVLADEYSGVLKGSVFWNITPAALLATRFTLVSLLDLFFGLEDRQNMFLRNV